MTVIGAGWIPSGHDGHGVMVAKACAATAVDSPEIATKALRTNVECILKMKDKHARGELKVLRGRVLRGEY